MADIKDELDALFDDEPEKEEGSEEVEETEEESEESEADDESEGKPEATGKSKAVIGKKTKGIGARTGAIATGKAKLGKSAVRPRTDLAAKGKTAKPEPEPEPEPEAAAPAHVSRAKVAAAPASSGGGALLVVSLVLNVILLVLVAITMGKVNGMGGELADIKKQVIVNTNISRTKVGIYTDRAGAHMVTQVFIPEDPNDFKKAQVRQVNIEDMLK